MRNFPAHRHLEIGGTESEGTGMRARRNMMRRGFTIRDLAVTLACLLVAASLLTSLTGATRSLSQTQVCAGNLRQLYAGMAAYVDQYRFYPPHAPYPTYMASETINGVTTLGWDPNIGFIMTHGLGLVPPATDSAGHFKWYGTAFADLPDVCKCPSMSPSLLDPSNPEVTPTALETTLYQYALSYQTSGTMRSATRLIRLPAAAISGLGGRNPPIPDPTTAQGSAQQAENAQRGPAYVYAMRKGSGSDPSNPDVWDAEYACWVQAVQPAEVQQPSRVYYLADSRDYRPVPAGWPAAGSNNGWGTGYGNKLFLGTRHFEYSNVLYMDGRVSRSNQTHYMLWNMASDGSSAGQSARWRAATFRTDFPLADLRTQVHIMPVLMVKGWEYFFETNGMIAK